MRWVCWLICCIGNISNDFSIWKFLNRWYCSRCLGRFIRFFLQILLVSGFIMGALSNQTVWPFHSDSMYNFKKKIIESYSDKTIRKNISKWVRRGYFINSWLDLIILIQSITDYWYFVPRNTLYTLVAKAFPNLLFPMKVSLSCWEPS